MLSIYFAFLKVATPISQLWELFGPRRHFVNPGPFLQSVRRTDSPIWGKHRHPPLQVLWETAPLAPSASPRGSKGCRTWILPMQAAGLLAKIHLMTQQPKPSDLLIGGITAGLPRKIPNGVLVKWCLNCNTARSILEATFFSTSGISVSSLPTFAISREANAGNYHLCPRKRLSMHYKN